jgi:hypothetical protein
LRKIVFDAHLGDLILLRFDQVDVLLFVDQDRLEQLARPVVTNFNRQADALIVGLDSSMLGLPALTEADLFAAFPQAVDVAQGQGIQRAGLVDLERRARLVMGVDRSRVRPRGGFTMG